MPSVDAVPVAPTGRPAESHEVPPDLRGRVLTVSQARLLREEEMRQEGMAVEPPAIRPGLMFEVEVAKEPDLSRYVAVDVDGMIELPSIGRVHVAGWTMEALTSYLREYYCVHFGRTSITVRVEPCPCLVSTTNVVVPLIPVAHRGGGRSLLPLWRRWRQVDDYRNAGLISLAPDEPFEIWVIRPGRNGSPSLLIIPDPRPKPVSEPDGGGEIIEEDETEDLDDGEPGDVWLIPRMGDSGEAMVDDWNRALRILRSDMPVLESLHEWDEPIAP